MHLHILRGLFKIFLCAALFLAGQVGAFQLAAKTNADSDTYPTTRSEKYSDLTTGSVSQAPLSEILEENQEDKDSANKFKSFPGIRNYGAASNLTSFKTASSALDLPKRYLLFQCLRLDC